MDSMKWYFILICFCVVPQAHGDELGQPEFKKKKEKVFLNIYKSIPSRSEAHYRDHDLFWEALTKTYPTQAERKKRGWFKNGTNTPRGKELIIHLEASKIHGASELDRYWDKVLNLTEEEVDMVRGSMVMI